jgi:hypothetical protein
VIKHAVSAIGLGVGYTVAGAQPASARRSADETATPPNLRNNTDVLRPKFSRTRLLERPGRQSKDLTCPSQQESLCETNNRDHFYADDPKDVVIRHIMLAIA